MDPTKVASFMDSIEETLAVKVEEQSERYSFDFKHEEPRNSEQPSFRWSAISTHSD